MEHDRRRTSPARARLVAGIALAVVVTAATFLGGAPASGDETAPPPPVEGPCGPNPCAPPVEGPCGPNPCAPPVIGGPCPVDVCHSGPIEGPCGPNPCAPPVYTCPNDVCPPPPGGGMPPVEVPPGPPPPADDQEPPLTTPPIWEYGNGAGGPKPGPIGDGPSLDGPSSPPRPPSVDRAQRLRDAVARIGRLARLGGVPLADRLHDVRVPSPTRGR